MDTHAYPEHLASFVRGAWPEGADPLPAPRELVHILSTAYQASLMRDEARAVTFRLLVAPPSRVRTDWGPPEGLHALMLQAPRPFRPHELRRLAPAAKYERALLGVATLGDGCVVWGVLQSGTRWLEQVAQGTPFAAAPVGSLVVLVQGPGRVAVACGETTLAEIRGGIITGPAFDVLSSRWFTDRFQDIRDELLAAHAEAGGPSTSGSPPASSSGGLREVAHVRVVSLGMLRRALAAIREARHGGTILFVAPEDEAWRSFVKLKYPLADDEPRRRYRTLLLRRMRWTVEGEAESPRREARVAELASIDEAIAEMSQLIAGLAAVDGAVVLNRRLEVLGFGGEIVGVPALDEVGTALDREAIDVATESIDGVGTRHRSAYRFCAAQGDAIAAVVSQDGGIQFVANRQGTVIRWDHTASGSIEV